ncbi:MAG TPA: 4-alpha-glucanotransferase [Flavitalea sp.]|nr:4-alpha-glucanotransferase [Flavitalea sp.]
MKIHFYLRYHTTYGQNLSITGNFNEGEKETILMNFLNHDFWQLTLTINRNDSANIKYRYLLTNVDGLVIPEGGQERLMDISKSGVDEIQVFDTWIFAGEYENVFYTDPFQRILLKDHQASFKNKSPKAFTHIFKVKAPLLEKNEVICICGSAKGLGEWKTENAVLMNTDQSWWTARINLPRESFPLQYKYGIYNIKEEKFIQFERGVNRDLHGDAHERKLTILHDGFVQTPNNTWKGAGFSLPVFSLRSKDSFGVGEFNDLKLLVDWAKKTGMKMIQILPVNDTTATHSWKDSYPYAAISAFALHPIYLNLELLAGKHTELIKPLRKKQKQLNEKADVDYEEVMKFKLSAIRELFELQKSQLAKDEEFNEFFKDNKYWLIPYAAFCYLRDRNGTSDFNQWKLYSVYNREAIEKYVSPKSKHYESILLHYYIQFHLHQQLQEAAEYAHKQGVILKGDLPIGIYRYGCDAWMEPELYHMDMQAGAPPDDFAVKGQNWGFPTYNWERMAEGGFEWWRRRFVQMSNYFDAFRIDHILGFFRIWSIPIESVEGIMGHFEHALPVYKSEFDQRGIGYDMHRFSKPYITDTVLWEMFGPNNSKFKPYLDALTGGRYLLKLQYNSQIKVNRYFETLDATEDMEHIRQGLLDLLSNVLLFEVAETDSQQFHFRFGMEKTVSFKHMDGYTQQQLKELYVDYFYRRQDEFWKKEAMKKLSPLKSATNMLVFGEDLGMVPHCVPDVMRQLGILSLEIQRMPKDPVKKFFHPSDAPYLSVVTPATHDMSPIRGWWEEDRTTTQEFYNRELGLWGDAPSTCEPWVSKSIILQHLYSPAMWSVFQLQDLLGMSSSLRRADIAEERINIPANAIHYWKYRMHIPLEQLLKEKEFNEELKGFVEASGR